MIGFEDFFQSKWFYVCLKQILPTKILDRESQKCGWGGEGNIFETSVTIISAMLSNVAYDTK